MVIEQPEPSSGRDAAALAELKSLVISVTGQKFFSDRDDLLRDAVDRRLRNTGTRGYEPYLDLIRNTKGAAGELHELIDRLTIGETSFFRYPQNFDALREHLRALDSGGDKSVPIRVWSAGCANGAEVYSALILAAGMRAAGDLSRPVQIIGTDINRGSLAAAEKAVYRRWCLRNLSPQSIPEWFCDKGEEFVLRDEYRGGAHFRCHNLVSEAFSAVAEDEAGFDAIMCCNVMIYFDCDTNVRLVHQFQRALRPDGILLIGSADFAPAFGGILQAEHVTGAVVYRRRREDERRSEPRAQCRPAAPRVDRPARPAPQAGFNAVTSAASAGPVPKRTSRAAIKTTTEPLQSLDDILRFVDGGQWKPAGAACRAFLQGDPLNPAGHYYSAIIQWAEGDIAESNAALRRALYLAPSFPLAHYELGRRRYALGDLPGARQALAVTLDTLIDLDDDTGLAPDGRVCASELRAAVEQFATQILAIP